MTSKNKIRTASLGFPRIGPNRELKKAVESYWKGELSLSDLQKVGAELRKKNWNLQKNAGISYIPSNDFSFYDHILDFSLTLGVIPERFESVKNEVKNEIDLMFAIARGFVSDSKKGSNIEAAAMMKWFDTNYHYMVPEFSDNQDFNVSSNKIISEYKEAEKEGIETRPVIIGPVSYLLLGKMNNKSLNNISLLDKILPAYQQLFTDLKAAGVKAVQIDEPSLVTDIGSDIRASYVKAYKEIRNFASGIQLHLVSYFSDMRENLEVAFDLGCDSVHLDLVRGDMESLDRALKVIKPNQALSLGLVDGRNIWINDISKSVEVVKKAVDAIGADRVIVSASCQLLHVPNDVELEKKLDTELKSWLSFAKQKLSEINIISAASSSSELEKSVKDEIKINSAAIAARQKSKMIHSDEVKKRVKENLEAGSQGRKNPYSTRKRVQSTHITLPILPTTTIGSFPQTKEVRSIRSQFKLGKISASEYDVFIKNEVAKAIKFQEQIGLDVLVHGEFERNDMVEYFGEQLRGFAFTENGWVQSYGSRCVKPPIIFGDVSRNKKMTVDWFEYAQSLTTKPVKGMLTGPITILQWSFVRNDQPRKDTAIQIAFAIRDEVVDLEKAGAMIVQIDEAALREGLPIRKDERSEYLKWAVDAFKITTSGITDSTQIHTHMCYSEFNDIIRAIAAMDADVISIETSRSKMELLEAFVKFSYPSEIGPGVYDVHSPHVPTKSDMHRLVDSAMKVLNPEQIWINPDCGLKTRGWEETREALKNMVDLASELRAKI